MKTFEDYYKKQLNQIKKCAKANKITIEEQLKNVYNKTLVEHEQFLKKSYETKNCHSFWHRECINKGIECHNFSIEEYDKMTKKQKKDLGIS